MESNCISLQIQSLLDLLRYVNHWEQNQLQVIFYINSIVRAKYSSTLRWRDPNEIGGVGGTVGSRCGDKSEPRVAFGTGPAGD